MPFLRRCLVSAAITLAASGPLSAQNVVEMHRRGCDGGELASCTLLGLIYETGAGGDRDMPRAIELYGRACDFGLAIGCTRLALARAVAQDTRNEDRFARVGYVADSETGAPIAQAVVELPGFGIRVLADDAGRVSFDALPRGRHDITAGRLGYTRLEGELPVPWETDFLLLLDPLTNEADGTVGRIVGRVIDAGTGSGIPNAEVVLDRQTPIPLITSADGRFAVGSLLPGDLTLRFSMLGYAPREVTVRVVPGEVIEVRAGLSTEPIELDPIEVRVGSPYLDRNGFYRRSEALAGVQFSRSDLDAFDPFTMTDILQRAPGVNVTRGRGGTRAYTHRLGTLGAMDCRMRTYLDGIAVHDYDLDNVRTDDLEAVEVYQGPSTPPEFQNLIDPDGVYPCGVVLIWTRRPR